MKLFENSKDKISIYLIIFANIVPIFGMLFLNWSLFSLLLFYWMESAAIGFFNILKMILVNVSPFKVMIINGKEVSGESSYPLFIVIKIFMILFFCLHFGGFMLGHLFFIIFLGSFEKIPFNFSMLFYGVFIPAISLFISHGYSFYSNYLKNKEYERTSIGILMGSPYLRIFLMHSTLILGIIIISFFGVPEVVAILFIFIKTVIDIKAHNKEHSKYDATVFIKK